MQDAVPIILIFATVLACSLLTARCVLLAHASAMDRAPLINWGRLCLVALPVGAVFAASWTVPLILLIPGENGVLNMGYPYLFALVGTQAIIFIPIVSSFKSVACIVLTTQTSGIP